jgi:hypothetical protein
MVPLIVQQQIEPIQPIPIIQIQEFYETGDVIFVIPENHPIYGIGEVYENHNEAIDPFPYPIDNNNQNEDGIKHLYTDFNYREQINGDGDIVYHSEQKWYSKFSLNGVDINLYCKKKYTSTINGVSRITIRTTTFNYQNYIIGFNGFDDDEFPIFSNQLMIENISVNEFPIQKFVLNEL